MPPRRDTPQELPPRKPVEIPGDLLARIEALPDRVGHLRGRAWTPEEDAALLKYWPIKTQADLARALGVSIGTARDRYKLLTRGGD